MESDSNLIHLWYTWWLWSKHLILLPDSFSLYFLFSTVVPPLTLNINICDKWLVITECLNRSPPWRYQWFHSSLHENCCLSGARQILSHITKNLGDLVVRWEVLAARCHIFNYYWPRKAAGFYVYQRDQCLESVCESMRINLCLICVYVHTKCVNLTVVWSSPPKTILFGLALFKTLLHKPLLSDVLISWNYFWLFLWKRLFRVR